jgi:hypothetical protein
MADSEEPTCPDWIDSFTEDVAVGIETGEVPAAYDVWGPDKPDEEEDIDDPWVVHFYPSLCEVVGGAADGAIVHPGLEVDLLTVQECFEDVEDLRLTKGLRASENGFDGAVLDITGWYEGHPVWLRIFDKPPRDAQVDSVIDHRKVFVRPEDQLPKK